MYAPKNGQLCFVLNITKFDGIEVDDKKYKTNNRISAKPDGSYFKKTFKELGYNVEKVDDRNYGKDEYITKKQILDTLVSMIKNAGQD